MNVLVIGLNFSPDLVGVGKYTGEMAAWLAVASHDVRVVTAPPYYPAWERARGWTRFGYRCERVDCGVPGAASARTTARQGEMRVWRCPIYVPCRPSGVRRLLHLASFAVSSFPVVLRQVLWRPRVVIVIAPTLFSAPGALLAARVAGAAAWMHVQDFEVDAAYELGLIKAGFLRRIINALEGWLLRRFDRVSTISEAMRERLLQKGVTTERAVILANWVDTALIHPMDTPSAFRERLGIGNGRLVALYSGAMGAKQGLELIVAAARSLQSEPVDFVLCGDGPAREQLRSQAHGLSNVRFMPLQPVGLLNELLNLADIHLLPQRADIADLVMPSKLAGMLASGRPIVATAHPDTQVFRAVDGCGRVAVPGDLAAFVRAIMELVRESGLRSALGAAGRARAESELSLSRILGEFDRQLAMVAGA